MDIFQPVPATSSQVLVLLSDTGKHGQTFLSVPQHSQTLPRRLQDGHQASQRPRRPPKEPQEVPKSISKDIQKLSSGPSKTIEKHCVFVGFLMFFVGFWPQLGGSLGALEPSLEAVCKPWSPAWRQFGGLGAQLGIGA